MTYDVFLEKQGEVSVYSETLLDGIFDKELLLHTRNDFVEKLGFCDRCYGQILHIISNDIDPGGYTNKYCPILFHDLIKPVWKLKQVAGFFQNISSSKNHYKKKPLSGQWEELW